MNIFLSYNHVDTKQAKELQDTIKSHGIDCFLYETHIMPGENINETVKSALNRASHLLVFISRASLKSSWVAYEVGMAEGKKIQVLPYLSHASLDLPSFLSHIKHFIDKAELIQFLANHKQKRKETEMFFKDCSAWGGIRAELLNATPNEVTFNGTFAGAVGYVVEGSLPYGGKKLTLHVIGSERCSFDQQKLCKFEVNGVPLTPVDCKPNLNDPAFLNARDGVFEFDLPSEIRKIEFVFWNATIKDLVFKCSVDD